MEEGFLRLSRKFFSNELWNEAREFSECEAWLDLIQSACWSTGEARNGRLIGGREISFTRGQYPASVSFLQKKWGWKTEKRVRCFLDKLRRKGMITTDSKQGINVITLCKYDEYNPLNDPEGQAEGQGKGQAKGKDSPLTYNDLEVFGASLGASIRASVGAMLEDFTKNLSQNLPKEGQARGNNKKNIEEYYDSSLEEEKETSTGVEAKKAEEAGKLAAARAATLARRQKFYDSLIPCVERYGKEMIRAFYDYWSELNKSQTKMRFETEKTWELPRRLATWSNREKKSTTRKPNFATHDNNKQYTDF